MLRHGLGIKGSFVEIPPGPSDFSGQKTNSTCTLPNPGVKLGTCKGVSQ